MTPKIPKITATGILAAEQTYKTRRHQIAIRLEREIARIILEESGKLMKFYDEELGKIPKNLPFETDPELAKLIETDIDYQEHKRKAELEDDE